jgi:hypothetical protein
MPGEILCVLLSSVVESLAVLLVKEGSERV